MSHQDGHVSQTNSVLSGGLLFTDERADQWSQNASISSGKFPLRLVHQKRPPQVPKKTIFSLHFMKYFGTRGGIFWGTDLSGKLACLIYYIHAKFLIGRSSKSHESYGPYDSYGIIYTEVTIDIFR